MIHWRHTLQIAPGRQADAVARMHEWAALAKDYGIIIRVSVVTTGTLGRLCLSADFESMGARDAAFAKADAHPDWIALGSRATQEHRDGTAPIVSNTAHNEFWRDA